MGPEPPCGSMAMGILERPNPWTDRKCGLPHACYFVDLTLASCLNVSPNKDGHLAIRISSDESSRCMYSSTENEEETTPRLFLMYGKQMPPYQSTDIIVTSTNTR